jgi:hypothetical protein
MSTANNEATAPDRPFSKWFCLKSGRDNFHIDPDRDHQFLFGKSEWKDHIDGVLKRAVALKEPVRLVWWGQYGIGKTHRLKFTDFWVQSRKLAFHPVHVVCRDIEEKSTFDRLHFDLVNNLGRERMQPWVANYLRKLEASPDDPDAIPLEQLTGSPDVIGAVQRFATRNDDAMQMAAWKFLAGEKLDGHERSLARVTRDRIDSSVEYAGALKVLGAVVAAETRCQLLYLVDQVEALSKIHHRGVEGRWVESLRAVLDVRNVGIVMAIGAERMDGLPSIMLAPEIVRRFTMNNYVEIGAFKRDQTTEFLEGLLREWIDAPERDAVAQNERWSSTAQGYDPATYPLTRKAFEVICRFCSDELDHKTAKPSEIIEQLNRIAYEAYSNGKQLIDDSFLKTQGITA